MTVVYPPSPADAEVLHRLGFQDGVAYMPVPRCETCRWWAEKPEPFGDKRQCWRPHERRAKIGFPDGRGEIETAPDFGCVEWEER